MSRLQSTTVLINEDGGTAQRKNAVADLQQLLAERLPEACVEVLPPRADLTARAKAACAAGAQIVAVAGGDGSLNAVAQALVNTDTRLGVLPFGTFNHFAHDLGVPLDLTAAVELLANGHERCIDVGAVNDHYFLNNASIGLYPELVELRELETRALPKPIRFLRAAAKITRHAKPITTTIQYGDHSEQQPIWLIFVGNNQYHLGIFQLGRRTEFDTGQLDVFVVRARRRVGVVRVVVNTLRGKVRRHQLNHIISEAITVQPLHTARCEVAFDGEVKQMAAPFVFRSVPQALRVIAPHPES